MDISFYFEPAQTKFSYAVNENEPKKIGDIIRNYYRKDFFPSLDNIDLAIIGVKEDRYTYDNKGCQDGPDVIRDYFYNLFPGCYDVRIADLGNIICGDTVNDTYFALSNVVAELIKNNIIPIIIGGGQDLTYANYKAYEILGQIINIVSVDATFDLGQYNNGEITSKSFLNNIIMHQPSCLFNYTNVGYQTYLVDQQAVDLMDKLLFDTYRLGVVREDMEEVEPIVRNADMLSFDISAIRISDAPGNNNALPNGFYGEEACQIARYAGISDKLTSIGFYEYNPTFDVRLQTASLISQIIWYFIEGFYSRKKDFPHLHKEDFIVYRVSSEKSENEIIFLKSKKSNRWWMELPCPVESLAKYQRHYLVPCSYRDYESALKEEMPDRWWQFYQKLM
ncbi:MAG: formimidoylglutamase [Bacteroidales bacterium]|nr:formimidoylglutamase [Bacteroidales bacterium]